MPPTDDVQTPAQDTPPQAPPETVNSGSTPTDSTGTPYKTFASQEEFEAAFGPTRDAGRLSLAKKYGYESIEDFDRDMTAFQTKKQSEMSEVDRLKQENKTTKTRESELAKENKQLKINSAAERIALEMDTDPKKLAAVLKLREGGNEFDAEGNVDTKALKASIKEVLAENPYFKRGGGGTAVGGGGTPANAASNSLSLQQQIDKANSEGRYMDAIRLQTQKLFVN